MATTCIYPNYISDNIIQTKTIYRKDLFTKEKKLNFPLFPREILTQIVFYNEDG